MNEQEMREVTAPTFDTIEELSKYIDSLANQNHDYGTCVYAMSLSAVAAFKFIAHKLGVTGFQASCADLDIIRRTRSLPGPFMIVNFADHLYPQYDLVGKLRDSLNKESSREWFKEQAEKNLKENSTHAAPNVINHWKKLAGI